MDTWSSLEADLRRTVESSAIVNGEGHVRTLALMVDLAECLQGQGRHVEAEALIKKTLSGLEAAGPEHTAQRMHCMTVLIMSMTAQRKEVELEPYLQELMRWNSDVFGASHQHALLSRCRYAQCLENQGRLDKAEAILRPALQTLRETVGTSNGTTLCAIRSLSDTLISKKQYAEAQMLIHEAVVLLLRQPDQHMGSKDVTCEHAKLAACLMSQGHHKQAHSVMKLLIGSHSAWFDELNAATLTAFYDYADRLGKQHRDVRTAYSWHKLVLGARRTVLGDLHPDTLRSVAGQASVLSVSRRAGDRAAAEVMLREVLASRRAVLGEQHEDTVESMCLLSKSLFTQGKNAEALAVACQVVQASREFLGEDHPQTCLALRTAANILYARSADGSTVHVERCPRGEPYRAPRGRQSQRMQDMVRLISRDMALKPT